MPHPLSAGDVTALGREGSPPVSRLSTSRLLWCTSNFCRMPGRTARNRNKRALIAAGGRSPVQAGPFLSCPTPCSACPMTFIHLQRHERISEDGGRFCSHTEHAYRASLSGIFKAEKTAGQGLWLDSSSAAHCEIRDLDLYSCHSMKRTSPHFVVPGVTH